MPARTSGPNEYLMQHTQNPNETIKKVIATPFSTYSSSREIYTEKEKNLKRTYRLCEVVLGVSVIRKYQNNF
jgi:hypothetical protein